MARERLRSSDVGSGAGVARYPLADLQQDLAAECASLRVLRHEARGGLAVASGIVGEVTGYVEGFGYVMLSVQGVLDTAGMVMR